MGDLRGEIADEIAGIFDPRSRDEMLEAADRILAIPEIAEALKYYESRALRSIVGRLPGEI